MVLDRIPESHFTETEQVAFGAGVLVDGLDFSDDKMLQGRTYSYSDTQWYRVGPNYLQLPINRPMTRVATNQRDGQMARHVDLAGDQNPHVNYEPSGHSGLHEAKPAGAPPRGARRRSSSSVRISPERMTSSRPASAIDPSSPGSATTS